MKNINNNLILQASFSAFLSSVSSFIYVQISPSICLCQPLSFSCISSTIFHYFSFSLCLSLSLSGLIEAVAAGRVKRYLIRRLNQWCGPMANPSANKKKTGRRLYLRDALTLALSFDFQFKGVLFFVLLAGKKKSKASHQRAKHRIHLSIHSSEPISNQSSDNDKTCVIRLELSGLLWTHFLLERYKVRTSTRNLAQDCEHKN